MLVAGLDPSSTSFGVAFVDGERLIATDIWTRPKGKQSAPARLVDCHSWLVSWLLVHRPEVAVIEFLGVERNAQTTRVISHYQALGALACKQQGLIVIEARVTSARLATLGNGSASKEQAYEAMTKRFKGHKFRPFTKGGGDEADAAILALAAASLVEQS